MPRLPKPGGDDGTWGQVLNEFLSVEHQSDGTLNPSGSLSQKYTKPDTGIPRSHLEPDVQADINQVASLRSRSDTIEAFRDGNGKFTRDALAPDIAAAVNSVVNVRSSGAIGDGVTDDTLAIQSAITLAATRGVATYIPAGVYVISASLQLPSNATLYGDGKVSEIKQIGNGVYSAIVNNNFTTGNSNLSIKNLAVNGNRSVRQAGLPAEAGDNGSNGIRITAPDATPSWGLVVNNVWIRGTSHVGLMIFNVEDVLLSGVVIDDTRRDGIDVWFNSKRVTIMNCIVTNCGDDCISICGENSTHQNGARVSGVTISGGVYSHRTDNIFGRGIYVSGAEDVSISGVVTRDTFSHGIHVAPSYVTAYDSERISVANCIIRNAGNAITSGAGISVQSGNSVSVIGNVIDNGYSAGISVQAAAKNVIVSKNDVRGGGASNATGINVAFGALQVIVDGNSVRIVPSYGISVNAHDTQVMNNLIYGCCDVSTSNAYIYIAANISRVLVSGNKITKTVGKGLYGIRITPGTSTNCLIVNNLTIGPISAWAAGNGVSDASSGTNVLANNISI